MTRAGGTISLWDGEASVVTLAQTTGGDQPADTTSLNGHVTATFSANEWLGTDLTGGAWSSLSQPCTYYLIQKVAVAANGQIMGSDTAATEHRWHLRGSNAWRMNAE